VRLVLIFDYFTIFFFLFVSIYLVYSKQQMTLYGSSTELYLKRLVKHFVVILNHCY
jgi:hypothetical protein